MADDKSNKQKSASKDKKAPKKGAASNSDAKVKSKVKKKAQKGKTVERSIPFVRNADEASANVFTKKRNSLIPKYFKESWTELRKVTWPSRKETWRLTLAVIVFSLLFTALIALADVGFENIVERVFL